METQVWFLGGVLCYHPVRRAQAKISFLRNIKSLIIFELSDQTKFSVDINSFGIHRNLTQSFTGPEFKRGSIYPLLAYLHIFVCWFCNGCVIVPKKLKTLKTLKFSVIVHRTKL